ncbi:MAG: hypothetical protein ACXACY_28665 [Candidatus Hodarchaeales archaeon]|jgi:hypothetical protein
MKETTTAHHPDCPYEFAFDVAGDVGAYCICHEKRGFPREVCIFCWQPLKHCTCDNPIEGDY